jgi:hypothetical protein
MSKPVQWLFIPPNGAAIKQQVMPGMIPGVYAAANAMILEFAPEKKKEMLEWLRITLTQFEHGEGSPDAQFWREQAQSAMKGGGGSAIAPEVAVMSQPAPPLGEVPIEVRLSVQSVAASAAARLNRDLEDNAVTTPEPAEPPSAVPPNVMRDTLAPEAMRPSGVLANSLNAEFNPMVDPCPSCGGQLEVKFINGMAAIKCALQGCRGIVAS